VCAADARSVAIAKFLFTAIWRYINFQNGGRPPSWNCFTTMRDHRLSRCCWMQLPVNFHVNLIHRSEDIAIWIFCMVGLKCLFRPPKWEFWGTFGPLKVIIHHRDPSPQKAHPCVNQRLLSRDLRIGNFRSNRISNRISDNRLQLQSSMKHVSWQYYITG